MGRSSTATHRIEFYAFNLTTGHRHSLTESWRTKVYGRPGSVSVGRFVAAYEASTRPGGVNAHLGAEIVLSASVIRQATWAVEATYVRPQRPAFEVAA
jgi:hypothetical protein